MSSTPPASGSRGPTPPPGGGGVSPLVIGKSFVKQYYQVLSTSPEHIVKFYKPNSVLSQGDGSTPSTPDKFLATTESTDNVGATLKERLLEEEGARIELGQGAIDAQESVGGGVLLVVTGHMVLEVQALRKSFCHTFFLNPLDPQAKKKHYYIHNDVLRFLHQETLPPSPVAAAAASTAAATAEEEAASSPEPEEPPKVEEPVKEEEEEATVEEPAVSIEEPVPAALGVEETKDEPPPEETTKKPSKTEKSEDSPASQKEKKRDKKRRSRSRGRRSKSRSSSPTDHKNKTSAKSAPNSWASLVAAPAPPAPKQQPKPTTEKASTNQSATTGASADSTPAEQQQTPSSPRKDSTSNKQSGGGGGRSVRRDPENTLVIKNVLEGTKEAEIRGLFEPLCPKTKAKILGITVAGHRGLAFVDYDSPKPVALALEMQQKNHRFRLNGRNLEVEPKSMDHRMKRSSSSRGGYNRSGSPGNGGRYNRGDRKSGRGGGAGGGSGGDRSGRGGRGGK